MRQSLGAEPQWHDIAPEAHGTGRPRCQYMQQGGHNGPPWLRWV